MQPQNAAGHPSMTVPRDAGIAVLKFWTEAKFDPDHPDTAIVVDWCEYAPKGRAGSSTQEKVSRLQKTNAIVWPQIAAHYEHWKKGQTMPTDGTPLIAWPGFPEGMIRRLQDLHIKTVEDFATVTDSALDRIGMGARSWQRQAIAFLENADRASAAAKQTAVQGENESLREQLAEMKAEIAALKRQAEKPRGRMKAAADKIEGDDE